MEENIFFLGDRLIGFNSMCRIILYQEFRKSCSLYAYIYIFGRDDS